MKLKNLMYPFFIAAMTFYGGMAAAQDMPGDELDATMDVMEEDEAPAETLALPGDAALEGVENSAGGLSTANEARELGREFGQNRAAEARDLADQARTGARDNATDARAAADAARERASEARALPR